MTNTPEMVERVARAIDPEAWGSEATLAMQYPIGLRRVQKRQTDAMARAIDALQALMSPTEGMVEAGYDKWEAGTPGVFLLTAWQAMIQAAPGEE